MAKVERGETVWKIGTGPESSPRRPPGGPKGSRSAASWRQKPTLERPPAIFQTVSPRNRVNKGMKGGGLVKGGDDELLVGRPDGHTTRMAGAGGPQSPPTPLIGLRKMLAEG